MTEKYEKKIVIRVEKVEESENYQQMAAVGEGWSDRRELWDEVTGGTDGSSRSSQGTFFWTIAALCCSVIEGKPEKVK